VKAEANFTHLEVLMGRLFRNLTATAFCVIALTLATGATALAAKTPQAPITGQPGAPNNTCSLANPVTPGNSVNSPGSPFNPNVTKFYAGNNNSGSLHANSSAAVSQYDVACVQLSH
jgi:hypothetical protein